MDFPIVARLGGELRLADRFVATHEPMTVVHISELADPAAYVSGGRVVAYDEADPAGGQDSCDGYVAPLKRNDIAALGIGLGPVRAELPARLAAACRVQDPAG